MELGPLLATQPQKAQFDRAARAIGRVGHGAALWELTELHMAALSRETATRSDPQAAQAEMTRLTAEVAQLRAAVPPPPQQTLRDPPPVVMPAADGVVGGPAASGDAGGRGATARRRPPRCPPLSPRTNWTRLVLPPVLSGHVSSL